MLSSTSAKIAQGEILQLQHKNESDLLEDTYIKIISLKNASLFSAATKQVHVYQVVVKKKKMHWSHMVKI